MEAINAHKDEPFLAVEREVRKAVKERAMYKIKLLAMTAEQMSNMSNTEKKS